MEKRSLSAEQWVELIKTDENITIPVCIYVVSNSMYPFIRAKVDEVTLIPARTEALKIGDIVLFPVNHAKADYFLHRIYRMEGDRVQTMGDANRSPDPWIPKSDTLGKVVMIRRGKLTIDCEKPVWVAAFRIWNVFWRIRPVMLLPFRVISKCKRMISKV